MLLNDRTALVYGASGAVGGAVARAFAREGARVVLAARNPETLEMVRADIVNGGGRAIVWPVDATDHAAVERHLDEVVAEFGPVRIMFNAVGLDDTQGEPLTQMPRERFLAPIVTAMKTWFLTGTACARHMARHGGGVILGISANAAREAYGQMGGFGVASGAVEHFLRHLAVENGPQGVRVCCIRSPGSPDAPGVREAFALHAREQGISLAEFERRAGADTPLRRLTPLADIADVAVLLASDYARCMTATVVNATGGAQVD